MKKKYDINGRLYSSPSPHYYNSRGDMDNNDGRTITWNPGRKSQWRTVKDANGRHYHLIVMQSAFNKGQYGYIVRAFNPKTGAGEFIRQDWGFSSANDARYAVDRSFGWRGQNGRIGLVPGTY